MKCLLPCSLILITTLFTIACTSMGNYETPRYTVTEEGPGNIELRDYQPMLIAEVTVVGSQREASNKGFRILADYIFGENLGKREIPMTAPVTQQPVEPVKIEMTSPVTQQPTADGESWVVAFMMPAEYTLETLPKTEDERIRFRETEPKRVAAIRFSGGWSEENMESHRAQLEQYLQDNNIAYNGYEYAFYDAPFVPAPFRRNEVIYFLNGST